MHNISQAKLLFFRPATKLSAASCAYKTVCPYADDMHLTYADKDLNIIQSSLNEDLLNISKWLIANKLTLNMTKTEFMLIGSRQKLNALTASPVLSINGTSVNQVSTSKSLGVFIDATLPGAVKSRSWLKKCLWYCSYQTGQAICSPSNIASYRQNLDSAVFRLLQCCLGKLGQKTSTVTNFKNSKIVQPEF